jgi:CheY-like chemotaxis protein
MAGCALQIVPTTLDTGAMMSKDTEAAGMPEILIIDDHAGLRNCLAEAFGHEGFTVSVAENGREGVTAAYQQWPAVILCDVMMPEMDGFALLDVLKRNPVTEKIPVVLFAALAEPIMETYALSHGAVALVGKDTPLDELMALVKGAISKVKKRRKN